MVRTDVKSIKKLIETHERRLNELKLYQAKKGIDTPADTILEIQDIEADIKKLKDSLPSMNLIWNYRIVLNSKKFVGGPEELIKGSKKFWADFKQVTNDLDIDANGKMSKIKNRRLVRLYDTSTRILRRNNYVLRDRIDIKTKRRKTILEFRHGDMDICEDCNIDIIDPKRGKKQFEKYVMPGLSYYQYSIRNNIKEDENLNKMKVLVFLFPGLEEDLNGYEKDEHIEVVNDFKPLEIVIKGASLKIKDSLLYNCELKAWYLRPNSKQPLAVEFLYKSVNQDMNYANKIDKEANKVLNSLQQLDSWVSIDGSTKTKYAYSHSEDVPDYMRVD